MPADRDYSSGGNIHNRGNNNAGQAKIKIQMCKEAQQMIKSKKQFVIIIQNALRLMFVLTMGIFLTSCVSSVKKESNIRSNKMVLDSIKNYKLYANLSPRIAQALKIAAETDFSKIKDGKYPVDGDNLFYMVQRYDTAPVMEKIEAHRKYIDIQFMAKGSERMGIDNIAGLKVHTPYSDEKDVEFFKAAKNISYIDVKEGMFTIFWPGDAHMPGRQIDKPQNITKVVFKIKAD
jgi:YhcH/YjgK/YiaL family protein